jgi:4'-phosphopantetheinyl transferase
MIPDAQLFWLEQKQADVPVTDDWLTGSERGQLERLHVPKRRLDWRLGRWTAKCAIASYLRWPPDRMHYIEIYSAPNGAPEATINEGRRPPSISISHCSSVGMCLLSPEGVPIGCDLEVIESRGNSFIETFFTSDEQTRLFCLPEGQLKVAVNLFWSAKESYLKATGEGLNRDTREVEVRINCDPNAFDCHNRESNSKWLPFELSLRDGAALGFWRLSGNMVQTVFGSHLEPRSLCDRN